MTCIFCVGIETKQILIQTDNFKVVLDIDPIQSGHLLIISKQHFMDIRELSDSALMELFKLQKQIINVYETHFSIDGLTIIQNNGAIMDEGTHFHIHIVPRYKGDDFWTSQEVNYYPISISELVKQLEFERE
ncbi:histidine triad (HIT) family protein [Solibacillus kalamii]|uniref:HIT family protein n=1 Tax=Solibacillus kalamii TaxID=1748298 RepID=A0ABX3ZK22_9BACL|nr:HIT family protein [Solibacillus kalamii]MBM7664148.1 histidine triad (HIT) family protein [Solibacillus kalamii]OUZ40085.1 HIT family protein [Solibacillus kalamii]